MSSTSTKPRGFAAMTPEQRTEISRKGGVTAHLKGTAHTWNPATAQEAGRKGGLARRTKTPAATPVAQPADESDT